MSQGFSGAVSQGRNKVNAVKNFGSKTEGASGSWGVDQRDSEQ
jgi:hypothetical protein